MKLPNLNKLIYLPLALLAIFLVLSVSGYFKKPDPATHGTKSEIKKENKDAKKGIKKEQELRLKWQQDSIKLARRVDSLTAFIQKQQTKEENLIKKEYEIRNIPVYTTDKQYDEFFSKRYRQKGLVR